MPVDNVGKFFGYAINVTYDDNQQFTDDDDEDIDDYKLFGWHIFIHETEHKFDGNDLWCYFYQSFFGVNTWY